MGFFYYTDSGEAMRPERAGIKKGLLENEKFLAYLFIAPAAALIIAFLFYPVCNVFYYSLQNYNVLKPWSMGFAGLSNFITVFTNDRLFPPSLAVSAQWVAGEVVLQLIFGMAAALLLNTSFKLRGLVRTLMFYPWAISGVLTAMMWALMYNQNIGILNDILLRAGIIHSRLAWFASAGSALPSVMAAELWRGIPFFAIMLLAGLQTIPAEIYEAAEVDGASSFRKFTRITLPYLKDSIILSTLLRTAWEFNNVDLIFNLTGGGPSRATTTLSMYIVNTANKDLDFGYACALSTVSFAILLVFAVFYLKLSGFGKEE